MQELDDIRTEREGAYGPALRSFTDLGLIWSAILQSHYQIELKHPIPPNVVCQMMVGVKSLRAVVDGNGSQLKDTYDDELNYTLLSREVDSRL